MKSLTMEMIIIMVVMSRVVTVMLCHEACREVRRVVTPEPVVDRVVPSVAGRVVDRVVETFAVAHADMAIREADHEEDREAHPAGSEVEQAARGMCFSNMFLWVKFLISLNFLPFSDTNFRSTPISNSRGLFIVLFSKSHAQRSFERRIRVERHLSTKKSPFPLEQVMCSIRFATFSSNFSSNALKFEPKN